MIFQYEPNDKVEEPQQEAEEGYANAEEASAGPSTTLLEKLAAKVDKLEVDMTEIKANQ